MTRPVVLTVVAAILGPALFFAAYYGASGWALVALLLAGVTAFAQRRLLLRATEPEGESSAQPDDVVERFYWLFVIMTGATVPGPAGADDPYMAWVAPLLLLVFVRWLYEALQFRELPAYDLATTWVFGVLLTVALAVRFLTGDAGAWLGAAVVVGIVSEGRGLARSVSRRGRRAPAAPD